MEDGVDQYLAKLERERRSSPAGRYWHDFHSALARIGGADAQDHPPPPPLVLAAAGESDATKLQRLGEQLRWAQRRDMLARAIELLERLPADVWNRGSAEQWHRDAY